MLHGIFELLTNLKNSIDKLQSNLFNSAPDELFLSGQSINPDGGLMLTFQHLVNIPVG